MSMITSVSNPRIVQLRTLQSTRGRKKSGLFLLESLNALEALLASPLLTPAVRCEVYYHADLVQRTVRGQRLLKQLQVVSASGVIKITEVSERVIEVLGEAQSSQGIVCTLPLTIFEASRLAALREPGFRPALLVLDDIADPGNLGTILRTALAADVERVLLTPRCVDYFSPKVLRAAVGAHFVLPVEVELSWSEIAQRVTDHCRGVPHILLAEAGSSHFYYEQDLTQPFALVIGNEAHGPSEEARVLATQSITIPLAGGVESLNAAMATGIILYEAVRQNKQRA